MQGNRATAVWPIPPKNRIRQPVQMLPEARRYRSGFSVITFRPGKKKWPELTAHGIQAAVRIGTNKRTSPSAVAQTNMCGTSQRLSASQLRRALKNFARNSGPAVWLSGIQARKNTNAAAQTDMCGILTELGVYNKYHHKNFAPETIPAASPAVKMPVVRSSATALKAISGTPAELGV